MPEVALSPSLSLSYLVLGQPDFKKTAVFLPGIMGSKKNLLSFVSNFIESHSSWTGLIFDLRNHGESSKNVAPFTLHAAAGDIVEALGILDIKPQAIIGHSFGGKVALVAAEQLPSLQQIWLWDVAPEAMALPRPLNQPASPNALEIMEILATMPWPQPSRAAMIEALQARHIPRGIALWMSTNVVQLSDGCRLIFCPRIMQAMLLSFLELDLWPLVGQLGIAKDIHLVAAAQGGRLDHHHRDRLMQVVGARGFFHMLEQAGHFLHSDNPKGLSELMAAFFK